MDPADLGYFENAPGSGVWRHPDLADRYVPDTCDRCAVEFMGVYRPSRRQRFCSNPCRHLGHRKVNPSYRDKHKRVERSRGPAAQHPCVGDCGRQSQDWSQTHSTTGEEPEHYEPRCRPCHRTYDGAAGQTHYKAKLTLDAVRTILAARSDEVHALAAQYGVTPDTVRDVRKGKTWKHVPRTS